MNGIPSGKNVLYGGSFNPIHIGHILTVQFFLQLQQNSSVLYVAPAGVSPFKTKEALMAPYEKRLAWAEKSFEGVDRVCITNIDKPRPQQPNYTHTMLEFFFERHGEYPSLLIGEDALLSFNRWKNWKEILQKTELLVLRRPDLAEPIAKTVPKEFPLQKVTYITSPIFEISSTEIRERIKDTKSIRGFVPRDLEEDIETTYRGLLDTVK